MTLDDYREYSELFEKNLEEVYTFKGSDLALMLNWARIETLSNLSADFETIEVINRMGVNTNE